MSEHLRALERKIASRKAAIGIVGLGYVGLPLAVEFARSGFRVTGIDVDEAKVANVRAGRSHVEDIPSSAVRELVLKRRLFAQGHYRGCGKFDAIVIAVPTPLRKTKDPDISYVVASLEEIVKEIRVGQLVILESTTYPGTTEEVLRPRLESRGLRAGKDFFLAFSPERVDPGNKSFTTRNTPKVVGGSTPACARIAALLYRQAIEKVHTVSSTQAAEMIKLLENTFRAVNIGLVNEIALMCEVLGLDVWEVIDGAATKPFGFMRFYPGPGIGGHCIPLDPHYLSWKLKTLNYYAKFIELASEINGNMPEVVVRRATEALNERRKAINGARVFVLGAAYKRDIGDLRESPALDVMRLLHEQSARVSFHDPYAREVRLDGGHVKRTSALSAARLGAADLVIIVTDHSVYDYDWVVRHSRLILDTRNATRGVRAGRAKIRKL
ncbi:MAG: nucleotide sugar dehydrogenase [Acidobacteriia bacterium]|nr:nucleotide sugar dehydrogenase [Terriglobia bacterium]